MFELPPYEEKSRIYFKELIDKYKFDFFVAEHSMRLSSDKCTVEITTGRYYIDFIVTFRSTKPPYSQFTMLEFITKKGLLGIKLLTPEQIRFGENLKDEIEERIYYNSIILNNQCTELLEGDFSIFEKK